MGHSLIYQALPGGCRLFARLQTDVQVGTLFAQLFNHGGGPYSWAEILDDLEEVLEGIAEDAAVFSSRAEVDRAMTDLLTALKEARAANPGLEMRPAYLEKSQWDIQERLGAVLQERGRGDPNRADPAPLVDALVFGAEELTPPGVAGSLGGPVCVVPPALVAEGARLLRCLDAEALFGADEENDGLVQDYRGWRAMILAAAECGEAIVVGD
jgi:hypothetical protein